MSFAGLTQTRQAALDPTGSNTATFYADRPMEITRWGWITTITALGDAATLTAAVQQSDSNDTTPTGVSQGGTLTLVAATHGVILKGAYIDAESFTYGKPITMVPGEAFEIVVSETAATGSGHVFIEFRPLPFQLNVNRPAAEPGATDTTTQLGNMSRLTA